MTQTKTQINLGIFLIVLVAAVAMLTPNANATLTFGATSVTTDGAYTVTSVATSTVNMFAANTSGVITIGGTAQTGNVNLGVSTGALTLNLGTGNGAKTVAIATGTGIDTINIGTGGTAADDINIGDALADVDITGASAIVAGTGDALTITANAASVWSASAGDLTLDAAAASLVLDGGEAAADAVRIFASDAAGGIDVDFGTGNMVVTGTGASADFTLDADLISIDGTGTSNVTVTAAAGEDFTVALAGAVDASLILSSTGTEADALQITASAGGIDIAATGAAGQDIDITNTGGSVNVTATEDVANAIYLRANGGTSETLKIHSDLGTGVASVEVASDVGGVTISSGLGSADAININASDAAGGIDIDFGTSNMVITGTGASADFTLDADLISIDGTGTSNVTVTGAAGEDFTIAQAGAADASLVLSSTGTAADAMNVDVTGTGGGFDLDTTDGAVAITAGGAANGDITLTVGDDFTLDGVAASIYAIGASTTTGTITIGGTAQTGTITLGSSSGTNTVEIGVGAGANTVNIATAGAAASVVSIGSANGGLRYFEETEDVAADNTLTASESGKTLYMGTAGEDQTLPVPADGVWYRFVVQANVATTNMTITGPAADATDDVIYGTVTVAGVVTLCSAEDTLTFVAETNEAIPGDWVELHSDGTNWYISGQVATASAFTCTDAD